MTTTNLRTLAPIVATAADPVRWFTAMCGAGPCGQTRVEPWQLPEPYRTLLVHEGSMTARLEQVFDTRTTLDLVSVVARGHRYTRVIRLLGGDGRCLEVGGVQLDLRGFAAPLRRAIVRAEEPLGRLLSRHGLPYVSVPRAFFAFDAPASVRDHLQMATARSAFGRCTDLLSGARKLGDVVEVLPWYDAQRSPALAPVGALVRQDSRA